jgi:hypothetical protein
MYYTAHVKDTRTKSAKNVRAKYVCTYHACVQCVDEECDGNVELGKLAEILLLLLTYIDATKIRRPANSSTGNSSTYYIRRRFIDPNIRRPKISSTYYKWRKFVDLVFYSNRP